MYVKQGLEISGFIFIRLLVTDDQAIKVYNQSLIKYNTAMFLLQQYTDALEALEKTCAIPVPPPPPTCPAQIAAAQVKVAQQNATATTIWIQVANPLM